MSTYFRKLLLWFSMLTFVLACVPTIATPLPTVDPNQVNQIIAQTANAAGTQTAAALPSATATVLTPTPQNTFTPSPTFTSTVIFVLITPTGSATTTPAITLGGGGTSNDDYACEILAVSPAYGTAFNGRQEFDASWTVKNIGQRNWSADNIDIVFDSGTNLSEEAGFDLPSDLRRQGTIDLAIDMRAPRRAGTYTTTWALRRGNNSFCRMSLTIRVN